MLTSGIPIFGVRLENGWLVESSRLDSDPSTQQNGVKTANFSFYNPDGEIQWEQEYAFSFYGTVEAITPCKNGGFAFCFVSGTDGIRLLRCREDGSILYSCDISDQPPDTVSSLHLIERADGHLILFRIQGEDIEAAAFDLKGNRSAKRHFPTQGTCRLLNAALAEKNIYVILLSADPEHPFEEQRSPGEAGFSLVRFDHNLMPAEVIPLSVSGSFTLGDPFTRSGPVYHTFADEKGAALLWGTSGEKVQLAEWDWSGELIQEITFETAIPQQILGRINGELVVTEYPVEQTIDPLTNTTYCLRFCKESSITKQVYADACELGPLLPFNKGFLVTGTARRERIFTPGYEDRFRYRYERFYLQFDEDGFPKNEYRFDCKEDSTMCK
ncbi:hypothetical protein [Anaerolentibacter hominis]|uniref:hypothetical protein n=1 Tax=Anaerolentibacter hominis TaxID=3079009 RepID=UPI0031B81030